MEDKKIVDEILFDFLFAEHIDLDEIQIDDIIVRTLSNDNVIMMMKKKYEESEH